MRPAPVRPTLVRRTRVRTDPGGTGCDPAGGASPAGVGPTECELPRCDDRRAAAMPTAIAPPSTSATETSRSAKYTPVSKALFVCKGPSSGRTTKIVSPIATPPSTPVVAAAGLAGDRRAVTISSPATYADSTSRKMISPTQRPPSPGRPVDRAYSTRSASAFASTSPTTARYPAIRTIRGSQPPRTVPNRRKTSHGIAPRMTAVANTSTLLMRVAGLAGVPRQPAHANAAVINPTASQYRTLRGNRASPCRNLALSGRHQANWHPTGAR